MTIQYRNETFDLTTTNVTTVLTVTTSSVAIVKTVQAVHDTASAVDTDLFIRKNGAGADVQISHESLNKETVNMLKNTLNLEAGDVIKMQAGTANEISGIVSYALIDRSQQNG
jgi:DNA-directed RNA polymerase sigma subunit (sigma70/sigma32)